MGINVAKQLYIYVKRLDVSVNGELDVAGIVLSESDDGECVLVHLGADDSL